MQNMEELRLGRGKLFACPLLTILTAVLLSLTSRAQGEVGSHRKPAAEDSTKVTSETSVLDSLCDRAAGLRETGERDLSYYEASMLCGRARFMSGDFRGASEVFGRLMEDRIEGSNEADAWMVRSLLASGMSDEALEVLETLRVFSAGDTLYGRMVLSVAGVLADQGDSEGAMSLIEKASPYLPDTMSCYSAGSLAEMYRSAGSIEKADSLLKSTAENCAGNPAFRTHRVVQSQQVVDEPGEGPYRLRVGWFMQRQTAGKMAERLWDDKIQPAVVTEKGIHRVELGPFEDYDRTEHLADSLRQLGISEVDLISEN